jgi:hypothetical protein
MKRSGQKLQYLCLLAFAAVLAFLPGESWAREVKYTGSEQNIYVNPGEPTQIVFPGKIEGGFKRKNSALALERNGNFLVLFAQPDLTDEGEALLVLLDDKRSYAIRVLPSLDEHPRDETVRIIDEREDTDFENGPLNPDLVPRDGFAPPTVPSGLIRNMILVAEMGKTKGIPGYRRSNRYTGETVLHDGALEAKIDEIFMGPDLWGYVLSVENLLDTNQKLNPASFRLDGTRAISAERWELAARPETAEQKLAAGHKAKVYIVTRALKH